MSSSALIEVLGRILFGFTRGVTEYYNPDEPEFTAESFGYNPLESTGREWYYQPVDELIYQEYSVREATSLTYLASSSLDIKVIDAYAHPTKMKKSFKAFPVVVFKICASFFETTNCFNCFCFSSHRVEKFIQCVVWRKNTYVSLIIGIFRS